MGQWVELPGADVGTIFDCFIDYKLYYKDYPLSQTNYDG